MVAVRRVDDPGVLTRRMLVKVDVLDGHWIWRGAQSRGYGIAWAGGMTGSGNYRAAPAHRVLYELIVGRIPAGLVLDHLCMRTLCVNPAHLEPVTQSENARRYRATITRCKYGHPFDEANTYIRSSGSRACRACNRANARRQYAKQQEGVSA